MRSSSIAGERGAAGPGYTQKKTHTHNRTKQLECERPDANTLSTELIGSWKSKQKSILMSSPDSWWQYLRIHLVKSSLKTVPDNRMSLNPLWTMQTCKFHWTVQLKNENCAFLKSNCWHEMQTAVNGKQNHDVSFCWSIQRSAMHDNRIWQTYMSIFPSSSNWPDSVERGPESLTLKSLFKTCGKYLIRTCNAKDFTNRLSLTSFQSHGTCSTIRKLLHVVVSQKLLQSLVWPKTVRFWKFQSHSTTLGVPALVATVRVFSSPPKPAPSCNKYLAPAESSTVMITGTAKRYTEYRYMPALDCPRLRNLLKVCH